MSRRISKDVAADARELRSLLKSNGIVASVRFRSNTTGGGSILVRVTGDDAAVDAARSLAAGFDRVQYDDQGLVCGICNQHVFVQKRSDG